MNKIIMALMLLLLVSPMLLAQRPGRGGGPGQGHGQGRGMGPGRGMREEPMDEARMAEMRDTIRFLRLSESRKVLKYDDEKLLMINDLLDSMENNRFDQMGREQQLREVLSNRKVPAGERVAALDEMMAARRKTTEAQAEAWARLKEKLTDDELLEVFIFYEKFQRDVRRRLAQLRGKSNGDNSFGRKKN